jgi:hypothetical protein
MAGKVLIRDFDGDGATVDVDAINEALVIEPSVSANVHRGKLFDLTFVDQSIASSGTLEVLIQTGTSKVHLDFSISGGGNGLLQIFEGPTITAAGTALTAYNKNRSSSNTLLSTVTHTPTLSADGTKIDEELVLGGGGPHASGGEGGGGFTEWILAASTAYLIRVENIDAVAHPYGFHSNLFESTL